MKPAPERDLEREIARSLVEALEAALSAAGAPAELRAARDAAQLLELPGLDRLISALAPHASHPWPTEIQPVVERLQRVCARAAAAEGLAEFRRADADFHGLAGEIVGMEWSAIPVRGGVEGPSVPTLSAAEMLSDLTLAGDASASVARRVRLTMPVAAAVRAALDWLAGREGVRQPLELRDDASVLEVVCELRDVAGVPPAHEVLSGVDGNLGPPLSAWGEAREGRWVIRVPAFSARPAYVMLEQGHLGLAVPWHAVLKLLVAPREAVGTRAARLGMSVLPPISPLAARGAESPVVIVAHGLRRAWMVADRLVWRLPADACDPDERVLAAGLERAVFTDDGEIFGLVEPRRLLSGAPLPPLPVLPKPRRHDEDHPAAAPHPPAERLVFMPPVAEGASVAEPPAHVAEAPEPAVIAAPAPASPNPIEVLDERWVTPLPAPEAAIEAVEPASAAPASTAPASTEPASAAAASPAPAGAAPEATPATPAAPATPDTPRAEVGLSRRALVAEDSITARVFLARLLEQQGFEVVAVERAVELDAALAAGPWSLVCVDVELPDARGVGLLRAARARLPEDVPFVVLVRDEQDITAARAAGVLRTLRKPVETGVLRRLLARLGLGERAS